MSFDVYRDGKLYVLSDQCSSCIFRAGNLMQLQRGRVRGMVEDCIRDQSAIPCHQTIYTDEHEPAICRGFHDSKWGHEVIALRLAHSMGIIVEVAPPSKEEQCPDAS